MKKRPYTERLQLPLEGREDCTFFTKSGTPVAKGYARVVIGGRGPYIEFEPRHILQDAFDVPEDQAYRKTDPHVYYVEARSKDASYVKLYIQKRTVGYADYKIGKCYLSPFELTSDQWPVLVED